MANDGNVDKGMRPVVSDSAYEFSCMHVPQAAGLHCSNKEYSHRATEMAEIVTQLHLFNVVNSEGSKKAGMRTEVRIGGVCLAVRHVSSR